MFECLEVAHEALGEIGGLLRRIAQHDRDMARQIKRAGTSIVSNIDEGRGNAGGRRVEHYRYAAGSANEVTSQLRVAADWGYVEPAQIAPALALLDRVRAMLWRLTH
jgi:four helix bundle protein